MSSSSAGSPPNSPNVSTPNALKLIKDLQEFVVERNETVDALQKQIQNLSKERDELKNEVEKLKAENHDLKETCKPAVQGVVGNEMTIISSCSTIQNSTKYQISLVPNANKNIAVNTTEDLTNELKEGDSGVDMLSTNELDDQTNMELDTRVTETHGESTSYQETNIRRLNSSPASMNRDIPLINTPSKKGKIIQRSLSRKHRRSDSSSVYELSTDLKAMVHECLENKYGGKEASNTAARTIQQCYRHYVLSKSFLRMRAFSGRRRSLTMPGKHFEKLKKTSLVFYGPNNPVMIVDDGFPIPISDDDIVISSDHADVVAPGSDAVKKETDSIIESAVKEYPGSQDSVSTDSDASEDLPDDDEIKDEDIVDGKKEEDVTEKERKPRNASSSSETSHAVKEQLSRTSSSGSSSQYDIIDDHQVLTVVGKHVDLCDGTTFVVDKIHDSTDGSAFSSHRGSNSSDQDEPSFDKTMNKRQFRMGVNLFNWKPEVGIGYLVDNGHLKNDVKSIADFFRKETTISKQKISEYFGSLRNTFNMKVLYEFASSFDYVGKDVDQALRQFQSYFKLTGEAQTVEKFLQVFSERYVECNPDNVSDNPDTILLLAFALAMLNTDLHNRNVKQHMTEQEFLKNLRGTNDGNDLDQEMLKRMYHRILKNEFSTGADHTTQVHQIENSFIGKVPNLSVSHRQFVKLFTVEEVYEPNRKEKPHNRLAFLFNDLLILAKPRGKTGVHGSHAHMFACKASYTLLNKKVAEFSNDFYPFGVLLLGKLDHKVVASFNAKDDKTRQSFVGELDEYIRETNGMENIRFALSKNKQQARRKDERTRSLLVVTPDPEKSPVNQRLMVDKPEASSLTDLREGALEGDNESGISKSKISMSASMGDISETESDYDTVPEQMIRSGSSSSLDPAYLSNSNNDTKLHNVFQNTHHHTLPRSTSIKKSLFGLMNPKMRKASSFIGQPPGDKERKRSTSNAKERLSPTMERKSSPKSANSRKKSITSLVGVP